MARCSYFLRQHCHFLGQVISCKVLFTIAGYIAQPPVSDARATTDDHVGGFLGFDQTDNKPALSPAMWRGLPRVNLSLPQFSWRKAFARPSSGGVEPRPVLPGYQRPGERSRWRRPLRYGLTFWAIVFYAFFILLIPRQLMLLFLMPLLIMFCMVIWAMPIGKKPPPKVLDTLFWIYFGSLFLWPNYLAITIPGIPWITIARLLTVPMMVILIWCASVSGPFKAYMKETRIALPALTWFVVAFSILQFVSIGFSDQTFITINRVFNNMLTWTVVFFASVWTFRKIANIDRFIVGYLVMTGILCVMTIFEAQSGGVLWRDSLPGFLHPADPLVDEILAGSYRLTGQYRVQATATTPLSLSELITLSIPFMFYAIDKYRTALSVVAVLVLDGLILNTLLLADTRSGFVAMIVGHMMALFYFGWRSWKQSKRSLIGPAITLMYPVMAIAVMSAVLFVGRIRTRVLGSGQHKGSNDARSEQWDLALHKIWESPLFGFGADRGGWKLGFFSPGGQLTVDTYLVSILMDYGIIGFILFYGMFIYAIFSAFRLMKSSNQTISVTGVCMGIFLTEFLVIKTVLSQAANHPLIFIAFGAIITLTLADRRLIKAPLVQV